METVSKLANKVVRGSQPLLNFNDTYSGCWQRKDMSLLLRLSVRGLVLHTLLRCVFDIFCALAGMYAKITIVTIGAIRVNKTFKVSSGSSNPIESVHLFSPNFLRSTDTH